jgi:hypothetical protein
MDDAAQRKTSEYWYYVLDSAKVGPVNREALQSALASGFLIENSLVWCKGMSKWAPAVETKLRLLWPDRPPPLPPQAASEAPETPPPLPPQATLAATATPPPLPPSLATPPAIDAGSIEPPDNFVHNPRTIRQEHIKREANVRSIGSLYFLGAGIALLVTAPSLFRGHGMDHFAFAFLFLLIAAGQFYIGKGLRDLNPRARTWATIISTIGLLAVPIGTLINCYIIYLMHSAKGNMVFSPEYKAVIEATPDMKYKTSKVLLFFLALLIPVIATVILLLIFDKK